MDHVLLIAPATREEQGIVTRLRRYESAFRTCGLTTTAMAPLQEEIFYSVGSWVHLIDPVGVVMQWMNEQTCDVETFLVWMRSHKGISVTLTSFKNTLYDHEYGQSSHMDVFLKAIFSEARVIFVTSRKLAKQWVLFDPRIELKLEELPVGLEIEEFVQSSVGAKDDGEILERQDATKRRIAYAIAKKKMVLFAGRLDATQSLPVFIETVDRLQQIRPDVRGVVVGPIGDVEVARNWIEQMERAGIAYIGAVDRAWMPVLYEMSTVVVDSSQSVEVSASIYEAMWFKKPVLVHQRTLSPHALPSDAVYVYESVEDAVDILSRIVDGSMDISAHIACATRFIESVAMINAEGLAVIKRILHEVALVEGCESVS